jgi:CRP/FNR family transcriptional regulator, cyclic AMP receptor protein
LKVKGDHQRRALDILGSSPWLSAQPKLFRDRLLAAVVLQKITTGATLYNADDGPGGVYAMVSGGVLISIEGRDGTMHPAHVVRQGTWFGFGPLMTRRNRLFLAQALEPSIVAQVPLAALERMVASDPASAKSLGSMTTYGQDAIVSCVADLLIRDVTARIAAVLLRVTGVLDGIAPDDPRGFGLTQTLIGELANASRPTVVRALAEFRRRGWIELSYRRLRVIAPEAMDAFVGASAPSGG